MKTKFLAHALVAPLAVAGFVLGLPSLAHAEQGRADQGQHKAAMCIGCHGIAGYQASFPEIHKVPMIAGQTAPYIVAALVAYKKGDRKHPTMRGVAESLSEQDMADLAAFYAGHAGGPKATAPAQVPPPVGLAAELIKKGNCASCHGANFSAPIDPSYPKLGGQHADYLYVALKAYATQGHSGSNSTSGANSTTTMVGRSHAIMGAQVKPFSHVELRAMASYLASLPGELSTVSQPGFR